MQKDHPCFVVCIGDPGVISSFACFGESTHPPPSPFFIPPYPVGFYHNFIHRLIFSFSLLILRCTSSPPFPRQSGQSWIKSSRLPQGTLSCFVWYVITSYLINMCSYALCLTGPRTFGPPDPRWRIPNPNPYPNPKEDSDHGNLYAAHFASELRGSVF